ncbi:Crp/Fnr family transcriptional regulator [Histidinibacterium aquaticum]|uniref:Crp/Fnr family transcriptional regulator n=1 Tax=Histidinibacterium aquaticum TaxID=2613962 RepID=UPI00168B31E5|nr:Crp/Fnr family transcriptional regulator [Histidinibacterium aquaticum]
MTPRVRSEAKRVHYEPGDELALQGEPSERIGILSSGLVKIVMITEDGEHHLLQLLRPGQIVGDPSRSENAFSWEAATRAEVCWINRETFAAIAREHPQLCKACLTVLGDQLEEHRLWVAAMRGRNAIQRIAFWLVQQVPDCQDGRPAVLRITLPRRDLASLLDMTGETLCRGLRHLSDRGAIHLHTSDRVEIRDLVRLRLFARCEADRVCEVLSSQDLSRIPRRRFAVSQTLEALEPRPAELPRSMTAVNAGRARS